MAGIGHRRAAHAIPMIAAMVVAAGLESVSPVAAHDIPADVTVQMFVRPDAGRLSLLLRLPLIALRDMDYPKRGAPGAGLLDVARADAALRDAAALWVADNIDAYEDDVLLGGRHIAQVRASLPTDRSFASYDQALAHLNGPRLPDDTDLAWNTGMLDMAIWYPIRSVAARFAIHPRLARLGLRTMIALRFVPPGGSVRALELPGDPGLVRLDPRWHQAAFQFVRLGFEHILDGTDHLLFLFCLVIPFRRVRPLIAVVTSFTVAHSITLLASAGGVAPDALWFPPLIETLIAASIVYMALENIASVRFGRRWMIAFGFGLVHGFGFSFALRQTLQFAGSHLLLSLLSFNVGVELGQVLVLALLVPALNLLVRYAVEERMAAIILSALVAHTAWHWMVDRAAVLRQYRFEWPSVDIWLLAGAMRWAMVAVIAAGLLWAISGVLKPLMAPPAEPQERAASAATDTE